MVGTLFFFKFHFKNVLIFNAFTNASRTRELVLMNIAYSYLNALKATGEDRD